MKFPFTLAFDDQIFKLQKFGGISRYFEALISNSARITTSSLNNLNRKQINAIAQANETTIVHATYYKGKPYELPGDQRLISTLHDMAPERYPEFFFLSNLRSPHANKIKWLENSDTIISVSASSADDFSFFRPTTSKKIKVVHHSTTLGLIAPQPIKRLVSRPFYLFVGKRNGYKNGLLLFRLFSILIKRHLSNKDSPILVFAGGETFSSKEIKAIRDNGIYDKIMHCLPNDNELSWLYRSCKAVLVPSFIEGFSFPLIEALTCNAVVFASDIEAHREIGGSFCTLLSPNNVNTWVDCILSHNLRPPLQTLGQESYDKLVEYYSIDRFMAEHARVYGAS